MRLPFCTFAILLALAVIPTLSRRVVRQEVRGIIICNDADGVVQISIFKYQCTNFAATFIGCAGHPRTKGQELNPGETRLIDGFWYKCWEDEGRARFLEEPRCLAGEGKLMHLNTSETIGDFDYYCRGDMLARITACYLNDSSNAKVKVPVGGILPVSHFINRTCVGNDDQLRRRLEQRANEARKDVDTFIAESEIGMATEGKLRPINTPAGPVVGTVPPEPTVVPPGVFSAQSGMGGGGGPPPQMTDTAMASMGGRSVPSAAIMKSQPQTLPSQMPDMAPANPSPQSSGMQSGGGSSDQSPLPATSKFGCFHNGMNYKSGETWVETHIKHKCLGLNVVLIGCVLSDNTELTPGMKAVKSGLLHQCIKKDDGAISYRADPCGLAGVDCSGGSRRLKRDTMMQARNRPMAQRDDSSMGGMSFVSGQAGTMGGSAGMQTGTAQGGNVPVATGGTGGGSVDVSDGSCMDDNGNRYKTGDMWRDREVKYRCNNGNEELIACILKDGSELQADQSVVKNNIMYKCKREPGGALSYGAGTCGAPGFDCGNAGVGASLAVQGNSGQAVGGPVISVGGSSQTGSQGGMTGSGGTGGGGSAGQVGCQGGMCGTGNSGGGNQMGGSSSSNGGGGGGQMGSQGGMGGGDSGASVGTSSGVGMGTSSGGGGGSSAGTGGQSSGSFNMQGSSSVAANPSSAVIANPNQQQGPGSEPTQGVSGHLANGSPCADAEKKYQNGDSWSDGYFRYSCVNGYTKIEACVLPDHTILEPGKTTPKWEVYYECVRKPDGGLLYRMAVCGAEGVVCDNSTTGGGGAGGSAGGQGGAGGGMNAGGGATNPSLAVVGSGGATQGGGGSMGGAGGNAGGGAAGAGTATGGTFGALGGKDCVKDGHTIMSGGIFISNNFRYLCKFDGSVAVIGCRSDSRQEIKIGETWVIGGFQHSCFSRPGGAAYSLQKCGGTIQCGAEGLQKSGGS